MMRTKKYTLFNKDTNSYLKVFYAADYFKTNDLVFNKASLTKLVEIGHDLELYDDLKMIDLLKYLDRNLNVNQYKHKTFYDMPADYQGLENLTSHNSKSKPSFQHDTISEFPPIPLGFSTDESLDNYRGSKEFMTRIKRLKPGNLELRED